MHDVKTIGQIGDLISKEITKYYVSNFGMGPKQSRVYIIENMIIVRLKINLLPFEKKLWNIIIYGFFITNTLCLILIFEILLLGFPYISLFLFIFGFILYINIKHFKLTMFKT